MPKLEPLFPNGIGYHVQVDRTGFWSPAKARQLWSIINREDRTLANLADETRTFKRGSGRDGAAIRRDRGIRLGFIKARVIKREHR